MTPSLASFRPPENLCPPLKHLHSLWSGKITAEGHLPARSDFDPAEMLAAFLPYITLFDVIRNGDNLRFRIRLVGTGIVEETGRDTTGNFLDEMSNTSQIIGRAQWMVENRQPIYVENQPLTWTSRDYKHYSALGVPLASDGITVDKIIYQMAFS
ncbi:PAS domain-containing protein [Denitrobaculum tricleocarpae]|uniref:PAS domain-containing protein n=1 Tax=Denitrobaculum tricleocarpae TaxID=2591009 RepID=A0A545TY13_9PROT|nr:PAS domain-containing protein [Denitrobaculum tricleocarpae]TQV82097.1 PAS domain-containing protein [Denitrobaculum tricleocarpae]